MFTKCSFLVPIFFQYHPQTLHCVGLPPPRPMPEFQAPVAKRSRGWNNHKKQAIGEDICTSQDTQECDEAEVESSEVPTSRPKKV